MKKIIDSKSIKLNKNIAVSFYKELKSKNYKLNLNNIYMYMQDNELYLTHSDMPDLVMHVSHMDWESVIAH